MSDKDLEKVFLNLKTEFTALHAKIEGIIKKYEVLEKQLESQKKGLFKCRKCKENFDSLKGLQKHKNDAESCVDGFKCDRCDKSYTTENDLTEHQLTHGNFKCEKCENKYDITGQLEKHVSAVHGEFKLFCHYYNNDKECPFEGRCIFAHEESPDCRFGKICERVMCMFSHDERDVSDDEDEDDSEDENNENENDDEECIYKMEDLEPSLNKVEEAMEKVHQLLISSKLKCNKCDFIAKNDNGLNMHQKAKHPDNSQ